MAVYCPRCGTMHGDHARFCVHCGTEMPNSETLGKNVDFVIDEQTMPPPTMAQGLGQQPPGGQPRQPYEQQTQWQQPPQGQQSQGSPQEPSPKPGQPEQPMPPGYRVPDYSIFAIVLVCFSGVMLCCLSLYSVLFIGGGVACSIIALVSAVRASRLYKTPYLTQAIFSESYRLSMRARMLCWMAAGLLAIGMVIVIWQMYWAMQITMNSLPDIFRELEKDLYWY